MGIQISSKSQPRMKSTCLESFKAQSQFQYRFTRRHCHLTLPGLPLCLSESSTWSWRGVQNQLSAAGAADGPSISPHSESIMTVAFKVGDNFTCAVHFHLIPRHHLLISINLPVLKNIAVGFVLFRLVPVYQGVIIHFALFLVDLGNVYA